MHIYKQPINKLLPLFLAAGFSLQVQAAETADMKATNEAKTMAHCHVMKEQKQKMQEAVKNQDAALTEKISKMNAAATDKKVALMAETITLMAEQRHALNEQKAKIEDMMQDMPPMSMDGKASTTKEK